MWESKHTLPSKISHTLAKLKEEYGFYIAARRIGKGYYLYKEWKVWDTLNKKQKLRTEYLGRLFEDGTFRKSATGYKLNMDNAIKLIESQGGKVTISVRTDATVQKIDLVEEKILTCLSMNARLPAKRIGEIAGVNASAAYNKIKGLEKRHGIEYTTQFYVPPLGYNAYLVLIKFLDNKPTVEQLRLALTSEPKIIYAVLSKGDYDVIGYFLEESSREAAKTVYKLRASTILKDYRAVVFTSTLAQKYGYAHLTDEFFTSVLKEKIHTRKQHDNFLSEREFKVLREINKNGTIDFSDIDKEHHLGRGASIYTYKKLIEKGIVVGSTISMNSVSMKYMGILFIKRLYISQYENTKHTLYFEVLRNAGITNAYSLICEVGAPDTVMLFAPVFGNSSIEEIASRIGKKLLGVEITTGVVTDNLIGHLCMRRFDNEYAHYYKELIDMKKAEVGHKTDYGTSLI